MRYSTISKYFVLLAATIIGLYGEKSFAAPAASAHGAVTAGSSPPITGTAGSTVTKPAPTPANPTTPSTPQNPTTQTPVGPQTTAPEAATPPNTSSSGTTVIAPGTTTATGTTTTASPTATATTGVTTTTAPTTQLPVFNGTGVNTSTTATAPVFPPTIISTVAGTGGRIYYISSDGFLYYAGANGTLVQFGRFLPKTLSATGGASVPSSLAPAGTGISNSTAVSATTPALAATNVAVTPSTSLSASNDVTTFRPGVTNTTATGSTGITGTSLGISPAGTVVGNNTILTKGSALPLGFSVGVNGTPVTINGIVRGNDGKTLYTGSDGNLYFLGSDKALHVVGSGASE